jgi:hypothetical protein
MLETALSIIACCLLLAGATSVVCSQENSASDREKVLSTSTKKGRGDEVLKKNDGEKRRDYAVLEAALNDLASSKNPEYKYKVRNAGPGKEIVVNIRTEVGDKWTDMSFALDRPNHNIDGEDLRSIPLDIQVDFKRRSRNPARSLADLKPASTNVVVADLDSMVEHGSGIYLLRTIRRTYPTAWGYVWAYPPGYSKDGGSAVVVFNTRAGSHGGDWVYMLTKRRKGWDVVWRHLHVYR